MQILTIKDLAKKFRLDPHTIRRAAQRGDFPQPLAGFRRLRWSGEAVQEWIRAQQHTKARGVRRTSRRGGSRTVGDQRHEREGDME